MTRLKPSLLRNSALALLAILAVGCGKEGGGTVPTGQGGGGREGGRQETSHRMEPVQTLEGDMALQVARTTSDARVALPWIDVTPTTAPGEKVLPAKHERKWTAPTVLLGREKAWINDKPLGAMSCTPIKEGACAPEAVKMGTMDARYAWADGVKDGKIAALAQAGVGWKGQQVIVLPDRRVSWETVHAAMQTIRAVGGTPILAAGGFEGEMVDALGTGTAMPVAATLTDAQRAANPGASQEGGLPNDAVSVTVEVGSSGVGVVIGRVSGEPSRPEVIGSLEQALIAILERLRLAAPAIKSVTLQVAPDAAIEEAIRVIDGVRDDCARSGHGQRCTVRHTLMSTIELTTAGAPPPPTAPAAGAQPSDPAAAAAPAALPTGDGGLHLNGPSGGTGLHLGAQPAGGLRLGNPGLTK